VRTPGECSCGQKFRTGEDFRDHLPCPGSAAEQAYRKGYEDGLRAAEKLGFERVTTPVSDNLRVIKDELNRIGVCTQVDVLIASELRTKKKTP